jgi:hypothetical protein
MLESTLAIILDVRNRLLPKTIFGSRATALGSVNQLPHRIETDPARSFLVCWTTPLVLAKLRVSKPGLTADLQVLGKPKIRNFVIETKSFRRRLK